MDRLKSYEHALQELVEQYAASWKPHDGTTIEAVTDLEHGHYQIVRYGWKEGRFIHSCLVHFTVRDQMVQLLKNDTDVEWDRELVDRGIAPDDIVLAFRQPVGQRTVSTTAYPEQENAGALLPAVPVLRS